MFLSRNKRIELAMVKFLLLCLPTIAFTIPSHPSMENAQLFWCTSFLWLVTALYFGDLVLKMLYTKTEKIQNLIRDMEAIKAQSAGTEDSLLKKCFEKHLENEVEHIKRELSHLLASVLNDNDGQEESIQEKND